MRVHTLDIDALTERLLEDSRSRDRTRHVVTANAQFVNLAEQREDFRKCLANADYICADGISVVLACKLLGNQTVSRVPGVDLMERLCGQSDPSVKSAYFLGGKEGAAEKVASLFAKRFPGFQAAGFSCPPFGFENDEGLLRSVLDDLRAANPTIVFVALGAPRQELFIQNHILPLKIPVAVGVGGSFDIISGIVQRAPEWMQRYGLEWAFRLWQEPRRLAHRYLVGNPMFCFYVLRYLWRNLLAASKQKEPLASRE